LINSEMLTMDYCTQGLFEILGNEGYSKFQERRKVTPEEPFVQGMLHRAGRAGFYYWLRQPDVLQKAQNPVFRFSPVKKKIFTGLQWICECFTNENEIPLTLDQTPEGWTILVQRNQAEEKICPRLDFHYIAGFCQEFASWAGLGKFYRVRINENPAENGIMAKIIIQKDPIDS